MASHQLIGTYDEQVIVAKYLDILAKESVSVDEYRHAFNELGKILGSRLPVADSENIMMACASEDADWLARGVLESLPANSSVAVFWNDRIKIDGFEYSPIVKSYIEPTRNCDRLIMVKSIISTSCVVKTQLTRLIEILNPKKILIASPVMYVDAEDSLKREFPEEIYSKFEFFPLAIDCERDEKGIIYPGVGGMVYPKLGLGDVHSKNSYMPQLVAERCGQYMHSRR